MDIRSFFGGKPPIRQETNKGSLSPSASSAHAKECTSSSTKQETRNTPKRTRTTPPRTAKTKAKKLTNAMVSSPSQNESNAVTSDSSDHDTDIVVPRTKRRLTKSSRAEPTKHAEDTSTTESQESSGPIHAPKIEADKNMTKPQASDNKNVSKNLISVNSFFNESTDSTENVVRTPSTEISSTIPTNTVQQISNKSNNKVKSSEDTESTKCTNEIASDMEKPTSEVQAPIEIPKPDIHSTSSTTDDSSNQENASKCPSAMASSSTETLQEALSLPQKSKKGVTLPLGKPSCLSGSTFVLTGMFTQLDRDEMKDLILSYGGKVAGSVTSKTTYLVAGDVLENGDPVRQGKKWTSADAKDIPIIDENALFRLISKSVTEKEKQSAIKRLEQGKSAFESSEISSASTKVPSTNQKHKTNKKPSSASAASSASTKNVKSSLWVDSYAPQSFSDLVGNATAIRRLDTWLHDWSDVHLHKHKPPPKATPKENPGAKAVLISGPPGIGKSSAARLVALKNGYTPFEMNASDTRSKNLLRQTLAEVVGNTVLSFSRPTNASGNSTAKEKRVLIMDEVDGMSSGDRGGNAELIRIIKETRSPIICICNDRQKQSVRSLANSCYDLKFQRPPKTTIAKRLAQIAAKEGLKVEENALEHLAESVGNDIRQVLNTMQMWARRSPTMTYAALRQRSSEIDKDAILRVNAFDAASALFNNVTGPSPMTFKQRYEQFFVDYDLIPLQVQQAYLQSVQHPMAERPESKLRRMTNAADAILSSDIVSRYIRSQQQWHLLPSMAVANVEAAFHAAGRIGFTGFPEWMGRNSTTNKRKRLLSELSVHMNSRISGGQRAVRLEYLETLRAELMRPLITKGVEGIPDTIELLDAYGLSKADLTDGILDFRFPGQPDALKAIPARTKAAFTKAYNATAHRSQALGVLSGSAAGKRKAVAAAAAEAAAEFGSDDETNEVSDEEEEEEDDEATIEQFRVKKKKSKAAKRNANSAAKRTRKY